MCIIRNGCTPLWGTVPGRIRGDACTRNTQPPLSHSNLSVQTQGCSSNLRFAPRHSICTEYLKTALKRQTIRRGYTQSRWSKSSDYRDMAAGLLGYSALPWDWVDWDRDLPTRYLMPGFCSIKIRLPKSKIRPCLV